MRNNNRNLFVALDLARARRADNRRRPCIGERPRHTLRGVRLCDCENATSRAHARARSLSPLFVFLARSARDSARREPRWQRENLGYQARRRCDRNYCARVPPTPSSLRTFCVSRRRHRVLSRRVRVRPRLRGDGAAVFRSPSRPARFFSARDTRRFGFNSLGLIDYGARSLNFSSVARARGYR